MDAAHRATDKELERIEKKLSQIYDQAAKELQEKADKYFERFKVLDQQKRILVDAGKMTEADYKKWRQGKIMTGEHWKEMQKQAAQRLTEADRIAVEYTNGRLPYVYALNYNSVAEGLETRLKGYSFELVDEATVRHLAIADRKLLPARLVDVAKDMRWNMQMFQAETLQGILQGESMDKIAKRIFPEIMKKADKKGKTEAEMKGVTKRARDAAIRNARTMVTGAENKGRIDMLHDAREKGVIVDKIWMAAHDSRTREAHLDLDGQQVPEDEKFESILGKIEYPGDPDAAPANVYNCRCTLTYKVVGFGRASKAEEESNNYSESSIGDLERPTRPRQSDYGGYTEEFLQARENYKAEMERYNAEIDRAVSASLNTNVFSSRADVESWAESLGIRVDPEVLKSIDIRSFNEVKPTLEEMFSRFPEVKNYTAEGFSGERLRFEFRIGTTDDGLLSANGGFNFNPRYFQDYENGLRTALDSIADGTLVRGDGSFSTLVRHEYGHNVQNYIETQIRDRYHISADDWRVNYSTFDAYKNAQAQYFDEFHRYKQELLSLGNMKGASEYSNTNTLELFAEGFAEWSSGGATEFGKSFGEFLRRWY